MVIRILKHHSNIGAKIPISQYFAKKRNLPRARFQHSAYQKEERCLAGAVGADKPNPFTGKHVQVDTLQQGALFGIGKNQP